MYPSRITDVHIELTDRCQASCPMCARNYYGGKEREFIGNFDISLEQFKEWFPKEIINGLNNFYACGNHGDPIIAKDCLEIFEYVRNNSSCRLGIHTNGSARTPQWWERLAYVLQGDHLVSFGIDGFEESHLLYRRGTNWKKIIENATAFINAGGNAEIDCLVFKHNENELEEFKIEMLKLGFIRVNFKYTKRFYDIQQYPVENSKGEVEYYLEPTGRESPIHFIPLEKISKDISIWEKVVDNSLLVPKCIEKNEVYIDCRGNIFPCCWIGADWVEGRISETMTLQKLRNLLVDDTKNKFNKLGIYNLNQIKFNDLSWKDFNKFLNENKPWTCVKNCNGRI